MQLHSLKRKTKNKTKRYIGRGGSRGKTSGRGHKGQKQHGGHGIRPEMRDTIKKLHKLRGRGKNSLKSIQQGYSVVNLSVIDDNFKEGEIVSPKILISKGILHKTKNKNPEVKILAKGSISKKIIVKNCAVSGTAKEFILKAKGEIL